MNERARTARSGLLQPPSLAGLRRVLPVGLGLSLAVLYLVALGRIGAFAHPAALLQSNDYPSFLTGARLVAGGQGAQLYDLAAQEPIQRAIVGDALIDGRGLLPYNHLPFLALALTPLAGLPVTTSYAAWMVSTLLALAGALALLTGELLAYLGPRPLRQAEYAWAAIGLWGLALGFLPLAQSLLVAQVTPWVLLGLAGASRAFRTGHEGTAGAWLALGLLKPQLIIVPILVLLLMRRWRAVGAFGAVSGAGLILASLALGGLAWIPAYATLLVQVAGASGTGAIQPILMMNWRGLLTQVAANLGLAATGWVFPLSLLLSALTVLGLGAAWWRGGWRPGGARPAPSAPLPAGEGSGSPAARAWDLRWAATILAGLLASPHLPAYELGLWLVPGVLVWRALRRPIGDSPPPATTPAHVSRFTFHASRFTYHVSRMPLLILGYLAGVVALPLAGLGEPAPGALAMVAGIPLLLGLAARVAGPGATPPPGGS